MALFSGLTVVLIVPNVREIRIAAYCGLLLVSLHICASFHVFISSKSFDSKYVGQSVCMFVCLYVYMFVSTS